MMLFVLLGLIFGALAAASAFLIIFDEYRRHKLTGWALWREPVGGAALAFLMFFCLSVLAGFLMTRGLK